MGGRTSFIIGCIYANVLTLTMERQDTLEFVFLRRHYYNYIQLKTPQPVQLVPPASEQMFFCKNDLVVSRPL